ncbi:biopolymer transporter ExbD [Paenalcaligenes niemegkensis]|uniref:ExbD/TolR family protein n=1 Tax=Paenalcaligenes niemegkensis TaxID=2895469 RepID=UPI001EE9771D|nr:biopolymer transporter ExbD [Paenalcaligenes niemegkensis]MCQ9616126.1 biopolymer transporter ExbD [Paenalcaligenes niemegkensis]
MSFGSFDNRSSTNTMSEINMVPLIDVMLVLLVIFLITAPLLTHSIKVQLPQATAQPVENEQKTLDLAVTLDGALFLNNEPVALEDLSQTLAPYATETPQPEIRIRADQETRYELLAQVMSQAKASGMARLGFVTRPGAERQTSPDAGGVGVQLPTVPAEPAP